MIIFLDFLGRFGKRFLVNLETERIFDDNTPSSSSSEETHPPRKSSRGKSSKTRRPTTSPRPSYGPRVWPTFEICFKTSFSAG